jgi:SAM-dependent methyltransferase
MLIENIREISQKVLRGVASPKWFVTTTWNRLLPKDPSVRRMAAWQYGELPRIEIGQIFPGIEHLGVTILNTFDRLEGTSLDVNEIIVLAAIAKFSNAKRIVEIGTFNGNTALNLAVNSPDDATVVTIDLPPTWNGGLAIDVPQGAKNVTDRGKIGAQYRNTPYANKIKQVYADSATLDWSEMQVPFDMAFIDGCHYYDYVEADTRNLLRNLKAGGILVWHDYGEYRDVSQVVDETAKTIPVKAVLGTRLAIAILP